MKLMLSSCASASWYHQLSFNSLCITLNPSPLLSVSASSAALKSVKKKRGQRQRAEAEDRGREQRQRGAKGAAQANVCEILSLSFVLSPHTFFPPAPMEMLQFNRKPWQPLGAHLTEPGEGETMCRPLISLVPTSSTL